MASSYPLREREREREGEGWERRRRGREKREQREGVPKMETTVFFLKSQK